MMQAHEGIPLTDAAHRMGLSTIALRRRAERGTVEAYKIDGRWYVVVPEQSAPVNEPVRDSGPLQGTASDTTIAQVREELAFMRGRVETMHALEQELDARRREVEQLHVMLQTAQQTAQRLLSAGVEAPQAPESVREDLRGDRAVAESKEPRRRGWLARLLGLE